MTKPPAQAADGSPAAATTSPRTIVVCIGNAVRGDDGAGPAVFEALRGRLPAGVDLRALRGDLTELVELCTAEARLVVVDAVVTGVAPGTVRRLARKDIRREMFPRASTHALGVAEALELAEALGGAVDATLWGIEAASFAEGTSPCAAVSSSVATVAEGILEELGAGRSSGTAAPREGSGTDA